MTGEELLKKASDQMQEEPEEEYEMPRSEAIAEHKRLVKVLRSGDKKAQVKEAELQEKELQKIMSREED